MPFTTEHLIGQFTRDVAHWTTIIERARLRPTKYSATDLPRWEYCQAVCRATLEKMQTLYALEQTH